MSKFLAIDTSSRYLTVLAVNGEKTVLNHLPDCAMSHSVRLMGEVDKALNEANLSVTDCDFISAVTGPGSFTGIRIGIASAKGFAYGAGKQLLSITSFELIAYNVADENFYVVIDAAHDHYYACGFGKDKSIITEPCYLSAEQVEGLNCPLYGFEELSFKNYKKLNAGECLPQAVNSLKDRLSNNMQALYVRKSQAEEGRK